MLTVTRGHSGQQHTLVGEERGTNDDEHKLRSPQDPVLCLMLKLHPSSLVIKTCSLESSGS